MLIFHRPHVEGTRVSGINSALKVLLVITPELWRPWDRVMELERGFWLGAQFRSKAPVTNLTLTKIPHNFQKFHKKCRFDTK